MKNFIIQLMVDWHKYVVIKLINTNNLHAVKRIFLYSLQTSIGLNITTCISANNVNVIGEVGERKLPKADQTKA